MTAAIRRFRYPIAVWAGSRVAVYLVIAMQDWTTEDMIFDVRTLIAFLSGSTTLLPGSALELRRGGDMWRIATCHFTHFTYEQLAWDALVFLVLGIACARRNRGAFQATLLASVVVSDFDRDCDIIRCRGAVSRSVNKRIGAAEISVRRISE